MIAMQEKIGVKLLPIGTPQYKGINKGLAILNPYVKNKIDFMPFPMAPLAKSFRTSTLTWRKQKWEVEYGVTWKNQVRSDSDGD